MTTPRIPVHEALALQIRRLGAECVFGLMSDETALLIASIDAVGVPVLVVQGERDRFGIPPEGPRRTVVRVPGDHGLRADPQAVAAAVEAWLPSVVKAKTPT